MMVGRQEPMAHNRKEGIFRCCRCQWSVLTVTGVTLLLYTAVVNVWLMRYSPCPSLPAPATPLPAATCDPCLDTAAAPSGADDDPLSRVDLLLGRWDVSRSYRIIDFATVGDTYSEISLARRVCLATQSSIERLPELLRITSHWTGPISVAVYVTDDEFRLLRGFISWLYQCRPQTYNIITFHIVMPGDRPANPNAGVPPWASDCENEPSFQGQRTPQTVAYRAKHIYPQNHLRNVARKNCHTHTEVFLVDIDIVPSRGMSEALEQFLNVTPKCKKCAYVVPTYELDKRVKNFPANKSELIRLTKKKLAVPFHKKVFIYNQYASNFSKWEESGGNESLETHVSHDVTNFELLYEPFYVATDDVPPHDERFLGYGFTRNSQVSMVLNGNSFCGGFIISRDYVLTAAHCVQNVQPGNIRLRVGSSRRDAGGRVVAVANVTAHAQYGSPQFDNDIAVLRLARPLAFSRRIRAVALPRPRQPIPLVRMVVSGWGLTSSGARRIPRTMMEAQVPVIPHWLCRLSYGQALTQNMFCLGHFLIGGVSSCQVYEMFLIGYQFRVLSPIFTVHWGLQSRRHRPVWREKQNEKNRKHFETFKRELFARYRKDPLHLLKRPPGKKGA